MTVIKHGSIQTPVPWRCEIRQEKVQFRPGNLSGVCSIAQIYHTITILRSTQPTNRATAKTEKGKEKGDQLPPELDFFKYAQGGATKRKAVELESNDNSGKEKRNRGWSSSDVEDDEDEKEEGILCGIEIR